MFRIATPISHLFESPDYSSKITEISDCLEARERSKDHYLTIAEVFHFDIQPIHELDNSVFDYLSSIKRRGNKLKLISFHLASSCDKPVVDNGIFLPGGKDYSEAELIRNSQYNFQIIRKIFGDNVLIAVENNNYYESEAYRYVTEASFIKRVVEDNDIFLLYDMAHARVTAYNRGMPYEVYRDQLPLDRMIQIHFIGHSIEPSGRAIDSHTYPSDLDFIELISLLKKYDVKYITPEYYKDFEGLFKIISQIRKAVH